VLHHNVTRNPNALWVVLQLHEAWECGEQPERFLIFDRDAKFSVDVVSTVKAMGSHPIRTAFRSPWQNGIAERGVRVVADYLPPQIDRQAEYERIFELERKLGRRPEFAAIARYTHHILRHAAGAKEDCV
jgi:hypothetical protein